MNSKLLKVLPIDLHERINQTRYHRSTSYLIPPTIITGSRITNRNLYSSNVWLGVSSMNPPVISLIHDGQTIKKFSMS